MGVISKWVVIKAVGMDKITESLKNKSVPDLGIINLPKEIERSSLKVRRKPSFSSTVIVTEARSVMIERSGKIKRLSIGFSDKRGIFAIVVFL